MKRFVEGLDRGQRVLFPETLDDFVAEDNAVRVIEAFVEALDLGGPGFSRVETKAFPMPSHHGVRFDDNDGIKAAGPDAIEEDPDGPIKR